MYIQINIGRNVGKAPMARNVWADFKADVRAAVIVAVEAATRDDGSVRPEMFETHIGFGTWDGVEEESAHVSVFIDHDGRILRPAPGLRQGLPDMTWVDVKPEIRDSLSSRLSRLAAQYGQHAIAFVVTDSHLAMRDAPTPYTSRLESAR